MNTAGKAALAKLDDEAAVLALREALRGIPLLEWVEAIDVEQALCEYSKYEAYRAGGISASKRFQPAAASADEEAQATAVGKTEEEDNDNAEATAAAIQHGPSRKQRKGVS